MFAEQKFKTVKPMKKFILLLIITASFILSGYGQNKEIAHAYKAEYYVWSDSKKNYLLAEKDDINLYITIDYLHNNVRIVNTVYDGLNLVDKTMINDQIIEYSYTTLYFDNEECDNYFKILKYTSNNRIVGVVIYGGWAVNGNKMIYGNCLEYWCN